MSLLVCLGFFFFFLLGWVEGKIKEIHEIHESSLSLVNQWAIDVSAGAIRFGFSLPYMFHIYPICIKCQGCHATSFQLIVFTADISGHSYQRAPSPTAPVHSLTIKTMPMLVRLAEGLWTDEVLGLPRSSWCHVYVLHVSTMWNKQVYEQLLGHSRRLALKDALHSAVPTIWSVSV